MLRNIAVGLDGSPESLAAADWAAREAQLRDTPLRLVYAWPRQLYAYAPPASTPTPFPLDGPRHDWAERLPREAAARLAERHPRSARQRRTERAAARHGPAGCLRRR